MSEVNPSPDELTEEEKQKIINFWNSRPTNPPSFRELIDECLGKEVDSRSRKARNLKEFLATRKIAPKNTTTYEAKGDIQLTEEHKQFIRNAINVIDPPSAVQIAKTLFNNDKITPLFQEARTVANEIKRIMGEGAPPQNIPEGEYEPPNTVQRALARIRKYTKRDFDVDNLHPRQKKEIEALIGYCQNYRFTSQIETYETQDERDLFESQFIRFTYDKHDLTEEEIEQYILLCTDAVTLHNIQLNIKKLEQILNDITDDPEGRITMGLTESIAGARKEYNECFTRQDKLLKNLVVKRSDRLSKQGERRKSLAELVEYVQDEKKREILDRLSKERKAKLKEEVDRIKTLDDLIIEVYGLDENEILGVEE